MRKFYRSSKNKFLSGICGGLGDEWNGNKISLHLDHINGISGDHRLENLRFLCPNCHSQTKNYTGRNKITTYAGMLE